MSDRSTNALTRRSLAIVVVVIGVLVGSTAVVIAAQNDALPFQTSLPTTLEPTTTTSTSAEPTVTTAPPEPAAAQPPVSGSQVGALPTTPLGPRCGTNEACATLADRETVAGNYCWTTQQSEACYAAWQPPTGPPEAPRIESVRFGSQDGSATWRFGVRDEFGAMWLLVRWLPSASASTQWYEFQCDGDDGVTIIESFGSVQAGIAPGAAHWAALGRGHDFLPTPGTAQRCRVRAGATNQENPGTTADVSFWSPWSDWVTAV